MGRLHSGRTDDGGTDLGLEAPVWWADQNSEVRIQAAEALGKLGEHAASAVPALTKCLEDENAEARRAVS